MTVGVQQRDRRAEVYVRDTGMGISSELLPHVFDRYRQARTGSGRRFGGLGLGLAIVKELVELHGGAVRVESAGQGCGAAVFVQLPCEGEALAQLDRERSSQEVPDTSEGRPLHGLRILVVEDDASALESLDLMLTEYGAEVSGVSSVSAALEALEHCARFQLLLSDLGLAPTDGFELLARVRQRYPPESLPAIAVTAFAREEDRARAMSAGFQGYVTKPYDVGALVVLAQRLCRGAIG